MAREDAHLLPSGREDGQRPPRAAGLALLTLLAGARVVRAEGARREDVVLPGAGGTVDLRDHLVFPGLVNAHDHLTLNAVPCPARIPPQPNSYEWIERFQPHFDHPGFRAAKGADETARAWHGGLKNLVAGTTAVAHHDPWCAAFDDPGFPLDVLRDATWSHSLRFAGRYGPAIAASYRSDRLFFLHLAEGTDEVAAKELSELDALGALACNTVLVHGVGLTAEDQSLVVERGAGVVWCPASNLFLLGATLDPRRLFDAGRLALGTDSRFTGSRDLLAELKVARDTSDLAPRELFLLATEAGARLLRLGSRDGDLFVTRDPGGDPFEAFVTLSRGDVRLVLRGGVPQVGDPDFATLLGDPIPFELDGHPKLARRDVWRGDAAALGL